MQLASQPSFLARWFAEAPRPGVTRRFWRQVRHGRLQELEVPPGRVTVHCRGGEGWITHDGDPRDVLLEPDQSYTADHRRRMTLHALRGDCVFEIEVGE